MCLFRFYLLIFSFIINLSCFNLKSRGVFQSNNIEFRRLVCFVHILLLLLINHIILKSILDKHLFLIWKSSLSALELQESLDRLKLNFKNNRKINLALSAAANIAIFTTRSESDGAFHGLARACVAFKIGCFFRFYLFDIIFLQPNSSIEKCAFF